MEILFCVKIANGKNPTFAFTELTLTLREYKVIIISLPIQIKGPLLRFNLRWKWKRVPLEQANKLSPFLSCATSLNGSNLT